MNDAYRRQVKLLLDVLPEVAKEECFARFVSFRLVSKACKLRLK